ncbi:hypothetical protein RYX36_009635 [Vicia faba]
MEECWLKRHGGCRRWRPEASTEDLGGVGRGSGGSRGLGVWLRNEGVLRKLKGVPVVDGASCGVDSRFEVGWSFIVRD